ncbi:MAG: FtsW/RodA/SpoVE family cell cycle protein [Porphyromonadaceae bacterium]|nr:MAG: FtsW/RodA/SpoVE family cell cycle protein [Porphyromonadaceae bacterium]
MDKINDKANRYEEMTRKYGDPWIWGIYFMLVLISIVETYSASSREVATMGVYMPIVKHCFFLLLGGIVLFIVHKIPYNNKAFLFGITVGLFVITLASLVYVQFFGEILNGARRSFRLFGISIQPSEFAKLAVVTTLSLILSRTQKQNGVSNIGLWGCVAVVGVFSLFTFKSGLTNFLLLAGISLIMMVVGGISGKKILTLVLAFGILGGGFKYINHINEQKEENIQLAAKQNGERVINEGEATEDDYTATLQPEKKPGEIDRSNLRWKRLKDWWNNDSLVYRRIDDKNAQEMFSRMAQAHGGVTGVFFGNSRESSRLPLAFSDYIFSIIVEDTGLIGGTCVVLLYLFLLARAAMIARRCRRTLPTLIVIGTASMITLQAFFHMAINTGVFPVSGQPLPLISKGGTSIIIINFAFAILLSISRTVAGLTDKQNANQEDQDLPENLRAENPSLLINYTNVWK